MHQINCFLKFSIQIITLSFCNALSFKMAQNRLSNLAILDIERNNCSFNIFRYCQFICWEKRETNDAEIIIIIYIYFEFRWYIKQKVFDFDLVNSTSKLWLITTIFWLNYFVYKTSTILKHALLKLNN